jgi:hypothetical protein
MSGRFSEGLLLRRLDLGKDAANTLQGEIRAKTDFRGDIERSLLYAPPDDMVFPIGQ